MSHKLSTTLMGWLSNKNRQQSDGDEPRDETAAQKAETAQIEKIEALLESVNSASQHVRNFYITFLLAGFYIAVIIWSTTDVMLLKDTPVNLPILNVELPITGFYTVAPYFFLILHFNLLLQLCLLADKLFHLNILVKNLNKTNIKNQQYFYTRIFGFAFSHTLAEQHHSSYLLQILIAVLVWVTIIFIPLLLLLYLQVSFLAYNDEIISFLQKIAFTLDCIILFIFWEIVRSTKIKYDKLFNAKEQNFDLVFLQRTNDLRFWPNLKQISFVTVFIGLLMSWGITFQSLSNDRESFLGFHNLSIRGQLLPCVSGYLSPQLESKT